MFKPKGALRLNQHQLWYGLVLKQWQAITKTSINEDYWHIILSLVDNVLSFLTHWPLGDAAVILS